MIKYLLLLFFVMQMPFLQAQDVTKNDDTDRKTTQQKNSQKRLGFWERATGTFLISALSTVATVVVIDHVNNRYNANIIKSALDKVKGSENSDERIAFKGAIMPYLFKDKSNGELFLLMKDKEGIHDRLVLSRTNRIDPIED